jgi:protein-disulfide isomerase
VSITSHRGASASKAAAIRGRAERKRRRALIMFGGLAATAIAAVVAIIAVQSAASSTTTTIPPRVTTGDGRTLGDLDAPVTVVEYADFQCPVCKRAESSIVSRLEHDYVAGGQVKIEFRMFPFIGQESFNAAQAADAAAEQGKFWEYHDALFNAQAGENSGAFTYEKLVAIAQQVGLDVPRFEATLSANTYLAPVQQEADDARANGVASTPTFFISDGNGDTTKIVGAQAYAQFQSVIDRALSPEVP